MFAERSDRLIYLRVLAPLVLATVTLVAVSIGQSDASPSMTTGCVRGDEVSVPGHAPQSVMQLAHVSVGAGLAWPRFQIDAAYDRSQLFKVGSISMVTRF